MKNGSTDLGETSDESVLDPRDLRCTASRRSAAELPTYNKRNQHVAL